MTKANINSKLQQIPNNNSGRLFFTTSTVENENDLKHVRIYEQIKEDEYNLIKLDDSKDSQEDPRVSFKEAHDGTRTYFKLIKDGQNYSTYADEDLQKELAKRGKGSFSSQLELDARDSIVSYAKTNNFPIEAQGDSFWNKQITSLKNTTDQAITFAKSLSFDTSDLKLTFEGRRRKEYENLFYPEDIRSSKQDRIRFSMRYISGSRQIKFDLENGPLGIGERRTTGINGSVTLPIPGGISDNNNVKFDNDSLDVMGALGFGALLNPGAAIQAGSELLNKALNSDPEAIREALGSQLGSNLISALRISIAQAGLGRKGMFSRIGGGVLNPNMELLFQSPGMRVFNFSFTMSARSRTEATQIKKIIRFFKQGMSVKRSNENIFIISPNTFKIQYLTGDGRDHPSIGKIKECALTDLNTTYGNGSTYMTFDDPDRTLTTYKIDMTFKELDPITEDDYLGEANTSAGPLADPDLAFIGDNGVPLDHIGF